MCGDQQSLSEVRRGLLVKPAMDFPKTAKIPASGFEDAVPFRLPTLHLLPKTFCNKDLLLHRRNGLWINPRNWERGKRWFYFPRSCWRLSTRRKGDAEDAEKGWRFVGFLAMNCHIWGGPEHPRSETAAAQQSGAGLPRALRHMGLPVRDSGGSGHRPHRERSSEGACTAPGPD